MFDKPTKEQFSKKSPPPPVEDIFATTEKLKPKDLGAIQKETKKELEGPLAKPVETQGEPSPLKEKPKRQKKKIFILAVLGIAFIGLAAGGWWILRLNTGNILEVPEKPINQEVKKNENVNRPGVNENINAQVNENINTTPPLIPPSPPSPLDSDGDGLTDDEEIKLGTDLENQDTDSDGLFDREEVKVYLTSPLDPDTDKDGFLDGEEVQHGYDPKGPGKLFELPLK